MQPLRILSWNLWHGLDPYQRYRMAPMELPAEHERRYRAQLQWLRSRGRGDNAVICLQEVNPLVPRFDELSGALGMEGGACLVNAGLKLGRFGVPPGLMEGLAIFAGGGFARADFEQVTLSGGALELRSARGAPLLTLQTGERRKALRFAGALGAWRVAVVNLHLHHGPDTSAPNLARKRGELARLVDWLAAGFGAWDLVAVCGDFNCDPGSPALEPLLGAGFLDSAELAGVVQAPTWSPATNPHAAGSGPRADTDAVRAWDAGEHVFDRIYLRSTRELRVRDHEVLREAALSDHFGVAVTIELG